MEGVPRVEVIAEPVPPPDLLQHYGEVQITAFGVTGTLTELASMCPVPPDDPRMTIEAKNTFVVNLMNEAAIEIQPEHEALFTQVLAERGKEPKFSVAPLLSATETPKPAETKALDVQQKIITPAVPHEVAARQTSRHRLAGEEIKEATVPPEIEIHEYQRRVALLRQTHEDDAVDTDVIKPAVMLPAARPEPFEAATVESAPPLVTEALISPAQAAEERRFTEIIEAVLATAPPAVEPFAELPEGELLISEVPEAEVPAPSSEVPATATYETFISSLYKLAEDRPIEADDGWLNPAAELLEPTSPLLIEIADRLVLLDPAVQQTALPIMENMVRTLEDISISGFSIEQMNELENLCAELLEIVGLPFDEHTVRRLLSSLVREDFLAFIKAATTVDLEHRGTHEIKIHFQQFLANAAAGWSGP